MERFIQHFRLAKEFEDETGLKIRDNKDIYIRWLETHVLGLRDEKESMALEIRAIGEVDGPEA